MHYITRTSLCIMITALAGAVFLFSPNAVSAETRTQQEIISDVKVKLSQFRQEVLTLQETIRRDGLNTKTALQQFRDQMQKMRSDLYGLRVELNKVAPRAPSAIVEKALARGATGEEVAKLQEFLTKFPRVYPEKLVTGNFGPATEQAVKRFQTSVKRTASGVYDVATRDVVNILRNAGVRKKPPKIQEVTPDSGAAGITIALRGTGFTDTGNAIVVRGKTVVRDLLASAGGTRILFTMPENFPCEVDSSKACPIKVVNAHGISNARPFKLVGLAIPGPGTGTEPPPPGTTPPPSPTPLPPPPGITPPPLLPSGPIITSISPYQGPVGTAVTIKGTGFTSTGNKVNFADTVAASNLKSQDSTSIVFTVPATPCLVGQACPVSVTNVNGASNSVAYLLTQIQKPITIVAPNGGEAFIQTKANAISWTGGTDRVDLVLVNDTAVDGQDPTELIVGWIASSTKPDSSIAWDAKRVCTREGSVCSDVAPGTYKLLAVSEDELGDLTIWNDFTNAPGNIDISDTAFTIRPEATITVFYPNGGEIIGQRSTLLICWESYNIVGKLVNIVLLKKGVRYLTIASNYQQTDATGAWIASWDVPDDLPTGSDYSILIEDAAAPVINDTSDSTFQVVRSVSSITVYDPNYGGEEWFAGFKGSISWESAYLSSAKAVDITLYKAGFPYRVLGTKIPQTYYWDPGQSYSTGWFSWDYDIPMDIPDGDDYMIEIADSGNLAVKDFSDYPFSIAHYPETLTLKANLTNYFTGSGISNAPVSLWDGKSTVSTKTDTYGWFTITVPTSYVMSAGNALAYASPNCFEGQTFSIYKSPYRLYRWSSAPLYTRIATSYWYWWEGYGAIDKSGVANYSNYYSQRLWPMVENFTLNTDAASKFGLNYRDGTTGVSAYSYSGGSYSFLNQHTQARVLPEKLDSWLKLTDKQGDVSYSPLYTPALGSGCGRTQTLSHFQNNYQWEPYTITAPSASFITKVGQPITKNMSASGGTVPYNWSVADGALAPQLGLQSGGAITGTTTVPGQYEAFLRVQDTNKVSGAAPLKGTVLRPDGTLPPTIAVTSPQAQSYVSKSWDSTISWSSTNLSGTNVRLELWKDGAYLQDITTFTQINPTGFYSYAWRAPSTVSNGAGYTIKIVDMSNPETFGASDPFWVNDWGSSALWNAWNSYDGQFQYNQQISFRFAASANPDVKSIRLYVKTPTDTSFTLATTLTDFGTCDYSSLTSSSAEWYGSAHCDYYGGLPYWYLASASHPASYYPVGEYQFKIVPVDSAGVEKAAIATPKLVALERVSIISPTEAASPIKEQTPTVRWSIPTNWPLTIDRYYRMIVRRSDQDYYYNYYCDYWIVSCGYWGAVAPSDTTGFRKLTGALPADIKYNAEVMMYGYMLDPATGAYIGYIGMSAGPSTFWYAP